MYQIKALAPADGAYKDGYGFAKVTSYLKLMIVIACLALLSACSSGSDVDDSAEGLYGQGEEAFSLDSETDLYPPGYDPTIPQGTLKDLQENIGDRVFFETDSSVLSPNAVEILQLQARWAQYYGIAALTIEGHADERGTREYNLALSARRANVVRDFLVGQGMAFDAIKTIAYGKERPVALCSEPRCWDQNRRSVSLIEE